LTRPWEILDSRETPDGVLELRRRADADFLLCLDGRILMNSRESRSEEALGLETAAAVLGKPKPRVLIAGLGMGVTLRSALAGLPPKARVLVTELQPCVVDWCREPLRELSGDALADPRVAVRIGDVGDVLREAPGGGDRFDCIALDLYEGAGPNPGGDFLFAKAGLERVRAALVPGGLLARWTEQRDLGFEQRLARAGFEVTSRRVGRGGRRHVVYAARLPSSRARPNDAGTG
jgi:spermidine synthase